MSPSPSPHLILLGGLAWVAPAGGPDEPAAPARPAPQFDEVAAEALPERALPPRPPRPGAQDYILQVNGGGVLLGDFDLDGDVDCVRVEGSTLERVRAGQGGFAPVLLRNRGDGRFEPAGEAWALEGPRWGAGGAVGDVDGDGDPDLVLTGWGRDRLYLNEGGAGFVDATEGSGLQGDEWSTSAAFLDYDGDGRLDLFVACYLDFSLEGVPARGAPGCTWKGQSVVCGPEGLAPLHDRLYRGLGDGRFEERSAAAGLRRGAPSFGLGVQTLDYDLDGDTDLYVANDSHPNQLWENRGDGTFRDVGLMRGTSHDASGREQAGMGIATGDLDGDGRADLFVTNFSGENNALYLSRGGASFAERSAYAGLDGPSRTALGWGTDASDFDHDGQLDLVVFNGHVYPEADAAGTDTSYAQGDHLFRGLGGGRFAPALLADVLPVCSRAAAAGDLDGDGDQDLVALAVDGGLRVYRNRGGEGHWLRVRLRGADGNTAALGARVELRAGEQRWAAEMRTAGGFQSAVPAELHFGLGAVERIEALTVGWPSGSRSTLTDLAVDRVHVLEEEP